jgi:hypothetical protein
MMDLSDFNKIKLNAAINIAQSGASRSQAKYDRKITEYPVQSLQHQM